MLNKITVIIAFSIVTSFSFNAIAIEGNSDIDNYRIFLKTKYAAFENYSFDVDSKNLTDDEKIIRLDHLIKFYEAIIFTENKYGSEYRDLFHDYVVYLVRMSFLLNNVGKAELGQKYLGKATSVVDSGYFTPWLKVDFEINNSDKLKEYVHELDKKLGINNNK